MSLFAIILASPIIIALVAIAVFRFSTALYSLERTVNHRGRTVRAFAVGARAGTQWRRRAAAQLKR
ncbi:MAG TPA: hypothetical protein VN598_07320 [Usitatibacter sp.]|nr:hypothetical protein [Usitatibacter sp.]